MRLPFSHNLFITLYNPVACDNWKYFAKEISRIITFTTMFFGKHDSFRISFGEPYRKGVYGLEN